MTVRTTSGSGEAQLSGQRSRHERDALRYQAGQVKSLCLGEIDEARDISAHVPGPVDAAHEDPFTGPGRDPDLFAGTRCADLDADAASAGRGERLLGGCHAPVGLDCDVDTPAGREVQDLRGSRRKRGVDEVGGTQLGGQNPLALAGIDGHNAHRPRDAGRLQGGKADAATT